MSKTKLVVVIETEYAQAAEELAKLLAEVATDNYDCKPIGFITVDTKQMSAAVNTEELQSFEKKGT